MREDASPTRTGNVATIEGLQLLVETSSWLAAWLVLPVWLGLTGAGASDFLLYAVGAGSLLSLGVATDRPGGLSHPGDVAWFAAICCFAVLVVGGAIFGITTMFR